MKNNFYTKLLKNALITTQNTHSIPAHMKEHNAWEKNIQTLSGKKIYKREHTTREENIQKRAHYAGRRYTKKEHTAANSWSALTVKFFSIFSSATAMVQDCLGASSAKFRAKTAPICPKQQSINHG